ncbi:hypothetical protein [Umezakia ovalisporum]|nr:hypothetical protein [Umezakia ovalisporum]MDH6086449.1 hypothetical protein [Umezakia ovalisporum TAC611]
MDSVEVEQAKFIATGPLECDREFVICQWHTYIYCWQC